MGVLDGLGAFSRVGGWEWGLEWYGISVFGVVGGENCLFIHNYYYQTCTRSGWARLVKIINHHL